MTMPTLVFDLTDLDQYTKGLDQAIMELPYAMALVLNDAAFAARDVIVQDTWPRHVTQRRGNFPGVALHVEKASKGNLHVELVDTLGRAHLQDHAKGGVKYPRGAHLAIPVDDANRQRKTGGVATADRPAALIARTPKNRLRVTERGIWVRDVGRLGKWRLRYVFVRQAMIPADVPFYETWNEVVSQTLRTDIPSALARAMKPRRRA